LMNFVKIFPPLLPMPTKACVSFLKSIIEQQKLFLFFCWWFQQMIRIAGFQTWLRTDIELKFHFNFTTLPRYLHVCSHYYADEPT
jgi:hypothetical protein